MIEKLGITPGPWGWVRYGTLLALEVNGEEILDDCSSCGEYEIKIDGSMPNGKLIAAAPEMLEALIGMCLDMEQYGNAWGSAEKIIEKATGRTWEEVKTIMESEK